MAFSAARKNELIRSVKAYQDDVVNGLSDDQFRIRAAESRKNFSAEHSHRLLMVHEHNFQQSDLFNRALSALNSSDRCDSLNLKNIYIGGPEKSRENLLLSFRDREASTLEWGGILSAHSPRP